MDELGERIRKLHLNPTDPPKRATLNELKTNARHLNEQLTQLKLTGAWRAAVDIVATAILLILSSWIVFQTCRRFGAQQPFFARLLISSAILVCLWLAWTVGSDLRWAMLFPHASVLLLANAFVLLSVAAAGLLVGTRCLAWHKEVLCATGLCVTAAWFLAHIVVRPYIQPIAIPTVPQWQDGVCRQSHDASCAAAAAATLLLQHQIYSTERNMAQACLTSSEGTMALGTYRGLCIATQGKDIRPRAVVYGNGLPSPKQLLKKLPMLAHVDFEANHRDSASQHGFVSIGIQRLLSQSSRNDFGRHTVVLLDTLPNDKWLVADPAVGRVVWSDAELRRIWNGEAIYLQDL